MKNSFAVKINFALLFIVITSLTIQAQDFKKVKIYLSSPDDVKSLIEAGLEIDHLYFTKDNTVTVFLSDSEFSILQSTGSMYEVLIDDWYEYYNSLPKLSEAQKNEFLNRSKMEMNVSGFGFGSMGGFYTLAEVIAELDSMKLHFPNLITAKISIGNSIENRPTYMVKISDNAQLDENEPEVLYTALHHAREPEGIMQMIYFMYYLLENYSTDPEVQYLVNNRELYFIPVVNPDGYEYNRSTNPAGGGMWRKNRRNNGSSFGVDLNRNYGPYAYWNAPNGGSSTNPSSETYRGTAPFSEAETNNIKNFLASRRLKNALNYHTYGNYLIYPYGALDHETPDSLIFREYAFDMTAFNNYTYGTDLQTVNYSTRGNSDDYFYDGDTLLNHGKIFTMSPEVGTTGFWPAQSEIFPLAIENVYPNLYYAWVAGGFVEMTNSNYDKQHFLPGDVVQMNPDFKNFGLSTAEDITIQLSSINANAIINIGNSSIDSIGSRNSVTLSSPLSFTVSASAMAESVIQLVVTTMTNSVVMNKDTLTLIVGKPTFIFADTTNNINNLWTVTGAPISAPKWATTNLTYNTPPNSYTDSPSGNYIANSTITMTLTNSINLTGILNPRLSFYTKYDFENNWDYGQVEVSTNNGSTWIPLQGQYTNPGTGSFQPNGEPLYDGIQSEWVKEEILLTPYISSQFKIRFELRSNVSIEKDGWYVDDIKIFYYNAEFIEITALTAFIEGFYNGTSMVPDTITVQLRNTITPYSLVDQSKLVLNSSGQGSGRFYNAVNGNPYYIIIKHCSAVETWSEPYPI